jgi:hypothetical protein
MWLEALQLQTEPAARARDITAKGHFAAFGRVADRGNASIAFMPFCDIVDAAEQPKTRQMDLDRFFGLMVEGQIGFTSKHYMACVHELRRCHAKCAKAGASAGGAGMASLVMNYNDGRITLAVTDLVTGREVALERKNSRQRDISEEPRQQTRGRDRDIDIDIDR